MRTHGAQIADMAIRATQAPQARYKTTGHGRQVIVPTRCRKGLHELSTAGYRIYETENTLHVACQSCIDLASRNHTWTFATDGNRVESAEFSDTL
jgi:hypothetical protein